MGRSVIPSSGPFYPHVSFERRRHQPIPVQGQWLRSVVQGHLAYYAVPGNTDAVSAFRYHATQHWFKALRRRSQRTRINWTRMNRIATQWLPQVPSGGLQLGGTERPLNRIASQSMN